VRLRLHHLGDQGVTGLEGGGQRAAANAPVADQIKYLRLSPFIELPPDLILERGATGERLEAAPVAAAAHGAIHHQHHVADLAGEVLRPVADAAVDDNPTADAGADE